MKSFQNNNQNNSEAAKTTVNRNKTPQANHRYLHKFLKGAFAALLIFFVLSVISVLGLRWSNPVTSSFMVQRQFEAWWNEQENFELHYQWVDYENMSAYIKMAAITSEDQRFAQHRGFDFEAIQEAIEEKRQGGDLRGASTITQQTAKNLFLSPSQTFIRKGIEAYFTVLMELLLPKERILELYLNIAAFGDGVYGVRAAANRYFNTSPINLSRMESALMVTALPNPDDYNLANPSTYMIQRRNWVLSYMHYLGGKNYLNRLE